MITDNNGNPWFNAKDVCLALMLQLKAGGQVNVTRALQGLLNDEKGVQQMNTPGGSQRFKVVSESRLYKLVMRSDKPEAKQFQDWVTRTVLTAIRKEGGYIISNEPIVHIKNGQPYANSRDVAAFFGKRHDSVLRSIDTLNCSTRFRRHNFVATMIHERAGATTREIRTVDMTKDGLAFLTFGFNGPEAGRFKEAYIERFNAMETELRQQQPQVPQSYAEALRAAADAEEQKQIAQQEATEQRERR